MPKLPDRVLANQPEHRPLERFWPYAELAEQPSDEELAALRPELRTALFGAPAQPFSISIEFTDADDDRHVRAVELAQASDEYVAIEVDGVRRHRARFFPGDRPLRIRDLYELVGGDADSRVLVDDQPVPYARELWLPLVWFLIR